MLDTQSYPNNTQDAIYVQPKNTRDSIYIYLKITRDAIYIKKVVWNANYSHS